MSDVIIRHWQGQEIAQRGDRYLNATAMCKANGKEWSGYYRSKSTGEFIDELSETLQICRESLVQVREGRNGGTWVHPLIAVNLAQWCSAKFAVAVSMWMEELLTTGRVAVIETPTDATIARGERIVAHIKEARALMLECNRGGQLEERDEIAFRDMIRTHLFQSSTPLIGERSQPVTLPERAVELGYARPVRGQDSLLGKAVARVYRERHNGEDPPKQTQWIDGRAVQVNNYTVADLAVVDAGIRAFYEVACLD